MFEKFNLKKKEISLLIFTKHASFITYILIYASNSRDEDQSKEMSRLKETIQKLIVKTNALEEQNQKLQQQAPPTTISDPFKNNSQLSTTNIHKNGIIMDELKKTFPLPNNNTDQQQTTYYHPTYTNYNSSNSTTTTTTNDAHMLNNDLSKFKSSLIKRGSLATRHLPIIQQPQTNVVYLNTNSQEDETDTTTATTTTTNTNDDEEDFTHSNHFGNEQPLNNNFEFRINLQNHKLNGVDLLQQQQQQNQQKEMYAVYNQKNMQSMTKQNKWSHDSRIK